MVCLIDFCLTLQHVPKCFRTCCRHATLPRCRRALALVKGPQRRWSPQDRPKTAPRPPQDHPRRTQNRPKTTPRPQVEKVIIFHQKCWFFIGKVCKRDQQERFTLRFKARIGRFGRTNVYFSLEIYVNLRGGRVARCMGSVVVAHLLASEARRDRTTVDALCPYGDHSLCLFPCDRSRESCGTWQLPQINS